MNAPAPPIVPSWLAEPVRELVRDAVAEGVAYALESSPARTPLPRIVSQEELAQIIRCSLPSIRKMRGDGCPVLWVGSSPRYDLQAVLDWMGARGAVAEQHAAAM